MIRILKQPLKSFLTRPKQLINTKSSLFFSQALYIYHQLTAKTHLAPTLFRSRSAQNPHCWLRHKIGACTSQFSPPTRYKFTLPMLLAAPTKKPTIMNVIINHHQKSQYPSVIDNPIKPVIVIPAGFDNFLKVLILYTPTSPNYFHSNRRHTTISLTEIFPPHPRDIFVIFQTKTTLIINNLKQNKNPYHKMRHFVISKHSYISPMAFIFTTILSHLTFSAI